MGLNTLFIGQNIIMLDKVDSTNNYLHSLLAKKPPPEGLVVRALEQYAGKGQRGSSWLSLPGANLTFSILLEPRFLSLAGQFRLTETLALGIAEFVSHTVPSALVKIKWPNDIYVNERKIAGILTENIIENATVKYCIAGIGLNVNQYSFHPSLPNPVSLKMVSGKEFDVSLCFENLCISIEKFYIELRNSGYKRIDALYHKLLYRKDILSRFSLNGKIFDGIIKGVSAQGYLLISPENDAEISQNNLIEVKDIKQLVYL